MASSVVDGVILSVAVPQAERRISATTTVCGTEIPGGGPNVNLWLIIRGVLRQVHGRLLVQPFFRPNEERAREEVEGILQSRLRKRSLAAEYAAFPEDASWGRN
jgi:hypothetical protein